MKKSIKFADMQRKDPSLAGTFKLADQGKSGYMVDPETGILFQRKEKNGEIKKLLVLPEEKRVQVMDMSHNIGHVGVKKTRGLIRKNFTFPNLKARVENFVASCVNCASRRSVSKFDRVPIRQYDRPVESFQAICLDVFGPIDRSSKGNQYVLGIVDLATNFCEMYPLKTLKSAEILENVLKWVCLCGLPKSVSMDNARNLNSGLCEAIYQMFSIEMINSTVLHSEGNSVCERTFGSLKHLISNLAGGPFAKNWDDLLKYMMFCYRSTPNELSGFSPYQLVYGHDTRTQLDVLYDLWSGV